MRPREMTHTCTLTPVEVYTSGAETGNVKYGVDGLPSFGTAATCPCRYESRQSLQYRVEDLDENIQGGLTFCAGNVEGTVRASDGTFITIRSGSKVSAITNKLSGAVAFPGVYQVGSVNTSTDIGGKPISVQIYLTGLRPS